jgi:hypothetical protein
MQIAKHAARSSGAGDDVDTRYAGHDASFHTDEWHAARLAALQMERPRCRKPAAVAVAGAACCGPKALQAPDAYSLRVRVCVLGVQSTDSCFARWACRALPRSYDDWKKQQDEAAAREAAMEAATRQEERESGGCLRLRLRLSRPPVPAKHLRHGPCRLSPALSSTCTPDSLQRSTRRPWLRSGRDAWAPRTAA